ncbi:MAG TPA: hypothetical protein VGQ83_29765 [Polyangia bacterium]|jgi:hypothetical protein
MARGAGVQALVTRWDWAPGASLDGTPYEWACGVHGQCTLRRDWLTRYVRGVGVGTLWLGPALVARLAGLEPLRAAAPVMPHAGGVRVEVTRATIDAVEAALEPLLPDSAAWEAAARG